MPKLTWKRIPRTGFIASHWVAKTAIGEFSIWQHVSGTRLHKTVTASLRTPQRQQLSFDNVSQAKARAAELALADG